MSDFIPQGPYLDFEKPIIELSKKIQGLQKTSEISDEDLHKLQQKKESLKNKLMSKLTPWNRVELSRRPGRPYTQNYVKGIFGDFVEIKGDRRFSNDESILAGFGKLNGQSIAIVGHCKGENTKESIRRNFGMASPEGYRKALRLFQLADKFNLPIISFIDTPGAYPGLGAEERGQAEAIAYNLMEMFSLKVPIISIVIGEGASGGALGIGICDRFLALENTWYCVISPEGCAAILWGDNSKKEEMAKIMRLTSKDLIDLDIADRIIEEPLGGAHWDVPETIRLVKNALVEELISLNKIPVDKLLKLRMEKYNKIGK